MTLAWVEVDLDRRDPPTALPCAEIVYRPAPPAPRRVSEHLAVSLGLVVAVFTSTIAYLRMGAGFVLDDWYMISHARFDGAWRAVAPDVAAARPGQLPIYALTFGLFGRHPLPTILIMAALNAATAVLTYRLLRRLIGGGMAATAAFLWAWLPTHTSTEVWVTCVIIAAGQCLLMISLTLAARDQRSRAATVGSYLTAILMVLCYEASLPVGLVAVAVLPWLLRRRLEWRFVVGWWAAACTAFGWIALHWYSNKQPQPLADLRQLFEANLGWGVGGQNAVGRVLMVVAAAGITLALARLVLPSFRSGTGRPEWAIVAGLVTMAVGVVPFAFYYYGPLGYGDRVNYLSAVGGALVWAGLAGMIARIDRRAAIVAVVGLAIIGGAVRMERLWYWHAAGRDAATILATIHEELPNPDGKVIVAGPYPVQHENTAAFLEDSLFTNGLQVIYGDRSVRGHITTSADQFNRVPAARRFDLRTVSELVR
jgi:hypothetical protein